MHENGILYKRAEAINYLQTHADETIVLEVNDTTFGMYAYTDSPNSYTLNFFALNPAVRKTREGYALYKDMKDRLRGKPVIAPVHSGNKAMLDVVKKRGIYMGRFRTSGDKTIEYYSLDFGDKEWKE
jgi:hypothetical protein